MPDTLLAIRRIIEKEYGAGGVFSPNSTLRYHLSKAGLKVSDAEVFLAVAKLVEEGVLEVFLDRHQTDDGRIAWETTCFTFRKKK